MLACAQAKARVGPSGRVIGIAPIDQTPSPRNCCVEHGFVDAFIVADARDALDLSEAVAAVAARRSPTSRSTASTCPDTELGSILCTKDDGTVYFFSMSTSFTAAALGAEGVGKDVTMIVGNGYAKRSRARPRCRRCATTRTIHAYFNATYASTHTRGTSSHERDHAPQAARRRRRTSNTRSSSRASSGATFPRIATSTRRRSSIISGSRRMRSRRRKSCSRRSRIVVLARSSIADAEAGFAQRADGRARLAVRDRADRLERSGQRSDPPAVRSARLGAAARSSALTLDSLHEQDDSPVPGLVHRYVDKALFLPLNTCPVYCRFCTRSYAIGPDTENVDKVALAKTPKQWEDAFQYISERPELEDIVISGGDAYQLPPKNIALIGNALLDIPHVRRMRFATKGPAIMPMKILTDAAWLDALTAIVDRGRTMGKDVVLHTHFNAPEEITWITQKAMARALRARHLHAQPVRADPRRQRHAASAWRCSSSGSSIVNVHPYYVYMHDMVKGVEELRTTIQTAVDIEKFVRGETAGFNTPTFICDAPGGGGKRDVHSFDYYDRENGICVYTAPSVKTGQGLRLLRSDRQALARRASALGRQGDRRPDDPRGDP